MIYTHIQEFIEMEQVIKMYGMMPEMIQMKLINRIGMKVKVIIIPQSEKC